MGYRVDAPGELVYYAMRYLYLVGNSDNSFEELNEYHVDMPVFVYFLDLGHHRLVEHVAKRLCAKVNPKAFAVDHAVLELSYGHELRSAW